MGLNRGDVLVVTLEAAMGADLTADPSTWTWTGLSSRTKGVAAIVRGRADEAQQTQPTSLTIRLGNTDGWLTPRHPNSSWYLLWAVGTPLRLKVTIPGDATYTRFQGRVTVIKPIWPSGNSDIAFVDVTAKGALYNLQQGSPPLQSPLHRAIAARPDLRAYWTMQDAAGSTSAASAIPGGQAMVTNGLTFAADATHPGSAPLPKFGTASSLSAPVTGTFAGRWQVDWYYRIPADPTPNEVRLMSVWTSDVSGVPGMRWDVAVGGPNPTILTVYGTNYSGTQVVNVGMNTGGNFFGRWVHAFLTVQQSGANISWQMFVYPVGSYGLFSSGTVAGTVGGPTAIAVQQDSNLNGMSIGHISVLDAFRARVADMAQVGHVGESPSMRVARLCAEQGIPVSITPGTETVSEDFAGPLLNLPFTGTWAMSLAQAHSGIRSFGSASIGDSQKTDAILNLAGGATSATFWYMVSSELNFDFFQIIRDGVVESQYSGTVPWTQRTVSLVGVNQLIFRYIKDSSTLAGSDAAWIDDLTVTGPSAVRMGTQGVDTLHNLLRQCEDAEVGILTDGLGAGLQFTPRTSRYNQPVALALDAARGQVKWPPFEPLEDDQRLRTKFTVSRVNGSSATYIDPSAKTRGEYPGQANLVLADDSTLANQAAWRTHLFTVPEMRTPSIAIDVRNSPELLSPYLATDIGKRYTAANPPVQYPPGGLDLVLEQYTETIDATTWRVLLSGSPYAPWRAFTIGDRTLGRLDTAGSKLTAGVAAGAVSLSVSTTTGPLWTTTPADFPLDINISGWQVTVTAISGATSPQTFTVQAVPAALAANAAVGLWRPGVLAL